jgi:hypothetical protein
VSVRGQRPFEFVNRLANGPDQAASVRLRWCGYGRLQQVGLVGTIAHGIARAHGSPGCGDNPSPVQQPGTRVGRSSVQGDRPCLLFTTA